jgi:hypothetical protein
VQHASEEPEVPEMMEVMRWIGFDEVKFWRVPAEIGGRLRDFAKFSHSDF